MNRCARISGSTGTFLAEADWIILGPEGGEAGGRLVCEDTPEAVARCAASHTGRFLRESLVTASRPQ